MNTITKFAVHSGGYLQIGKISDSMISTLQPWNTMKLPWHLIQERLWRSTKGKKITCLIQPFQNWFAFLLLQCALCLEAGV